MHKRLKQGLFWRRPGGRVKHNEYDTSINNELHTGVEKSRHILLIRGPWTQAREQNNPYQKTLKLGLSGQ